jgi:hypothetical protein
MDRNEVRFRGGQTLGLGLGLGLGVSVGVGVGGRAQDIVFLENLQLSGQRIAINPQSFFNARGVYPY